MLAPAPVAPRAQRSGRRSVHRTAPEPVRTERTSPRDSDRAAIANARPAFTARDGQQLLFDPDAPPVAPVRDVPAPAPGGQGELCFERDKPGCRSLCESGHPRRRASDFPPGDPRCRGAQPPAFDHPRRRASDFLEPDPPRRIGLREIVDSLTIVVMSLSLGAFLLLSVGSGMWVIKSFLGIDLVPTAHASEMFLGIEHDTPSVFGGASGGATASSGGGPDFPLLGALDDGGGGRR